MFMVPNTKILWKFKKAILIKLSINLIFLYLYFELTFNYQTDRNIFFKIKSLWGLKQANTSIFDKVMKTGS